MPAPVQVLRPNQQDVPGIRRKTAPLPWLKGFTDTPRREISMGRVLRLTCIFAKSERRQFDLNQRALCLETIGFNHACHRHCMNEKMPPMLELGSQLQQADPLADARAWLAHMQQTLVRLAGERAREKENDGLDAPLKRDDRQLEDRSPAPTR